MNLFYISSIYPDGVTSFEATSVHQLPIQFPLVFHFHVSRGILYRSFAEVIFICFPFHAVYLNFLNPSFCQLLLLAPTHPYTSTVLKKDTVLVLFSSFFWRFWSFFHFISMYKDVYESENTEIGRIRHFQQIANPKIRSILLFI